MDRVYFNGTSAQTIATHAGIGYAPPETSPILNTNNPTSPTPPTGKMSNMAGAVVGGSVVEGISSIVTTGMNNATQKEIAKANNETTMGVAKLETDTQRYNTDQNIKLGTAQLDFSKQQWSKEWDAANSLGLYSPSQLPSLYGGDQTRVYQLGYRSLQSVPRSKHRNMFTLY